MRERYQAQEPTSTLEDQNLPERVLLQRCVDVRQRAEPAADNDVVELAVVEDVRPRRVVHEVMCRSRKRRRRRLNPGLRVAPLVRRLARCGVSGEYGGFPRAEVERGDGRLGGLEVVHIGQSKRAFGAAAEMCEVGHVGIDVSAGRQDRGAWALKERLSLYRALYLDDNVNRWTE